MSTAQPSGWPPAITRTLDVEVDRSTWPSGRAPSPGLLARAGTAVQLDMLEVLCQVARCTAPPISHGFSLSEYWAWMRYLPALSPDRKLRLRPEWTALDSHQKTVLSDDLGMGVTTTLFRRALGLVTLSSTQYIVSRVGPPRLYLRPPSKKGPAKSPDFIGFDASGRVCVIECKGTQIFGKLDKALDGGIPQKRNLVVGGTLVVAESVVAGLFIPQHGVKQSSYCRFIDPEIEKGLEGDGEGEDAWLAFAQADLAAALHLMGFGREGNAVALNEPETFTTLRQRAEELSEVMVENEPFIARTRSVFYPRPVKTDEGTEFAGLHASIGLSKELFELFSRGSSDKAVHVAAESARRASRWRSESLRSGFLMVTPTGMLVKLELLAQNSGGTRGLRSGTPVKVGGPTRRT